MRIKSVEAVALSTYEVLVFVKAADIYGLGACYPIRVAAGAKNITCFVNEVLGPLVTGEDATQIDVLWHRMFHYTTQRHGDRGLHLVGIAGVDIALWDLLGKFTNMPLYNLLGGLFHPKIPIYASLGDGKLLEPEEMAQRAVNSAAQGFNSFKIRMHWGDNSLDENPRKDLAMFIAVRKALSADAQISFDANNGYSVPTAIQIGLHLQENGAYHFEEPVARYDYKGLKKVCNALSLPVSAGEQEYTRWQFRDLIELSDIDIIQPDILKCGGISEIKRIINYADVHNKLVVPHQNDVGVGLMATLHVMASHHRPLRPQEYETSQPDIRRLFIGLPELIDSSFSLGETAGLGLEVDFQALEELRLRL